MKLGICITHYNEPEEVCEPLLRSIEIQQGININDVYVTIVNDGEEGLLSEPFLKKFDLPNLKYMVMPKGNVSKARNYAMDHTDADYIMFCDCDDMFLNNMGLRLVFSAMNEGYDYIASTFIEEAYINNEYKLVRHDKDITFIHGKAFNKKFLVDNNIRWNEKLYIHEDGYFNSIAHVVSESPKVIETPFYIWKWNGNSVVRKDTSNYLLKTYKNLMDSRMATCSEFEKRGYISEYMDSVAKTVLDSYYDFMKPECLEPENAKLVHKAEHEFKRFYTKFGQTWKECNIKRIGEIAYLCRTNAFTKGLRIESMSISDWLTHIVKDVK